MKVLHVRNVNEALYRGIDLLMHEGVKVAPRGRPTIEAPFPVATIYDHPCERVLFDPVRDANPFFHFFESLWVLAGRKDVAFLSQFNSRIADYSDDGKTFHAAYGYRLRYEFSGTDQFEKLVRLLEKEPTTRRGVLQIWHCQKDLGVETKDVPCNDLIFFLERDGKLNMTVCCRSNDILWGAYGSNAVQFSYILEYVAARLNVAVGTYTQFSHSYHMYTDIELWEKVSDIEWYDYYVSGGVRPYPIMESPDEFDYELNMCLASLDIDGGRGMEKIVWSNGFFPRVVIPLWKAWQVRKMNRLAIDEALNELEGCEASDWRFACKRWMERRRRTKL